MAIPKNKTDNLLCVEEEGLGELALTRRENELKSFRRRDFCNAQLDNGQKNDGQTMLSCFDHKLSKTFCSISSFFFIKEVFHGHF